MSVNPILKNIEENLQTASDVSELLSNVGIASSHTTDNVYIDCPLCGKHKKIFIKAVNHGQEYMKWTCMNLNCKVGEKRTAQYYFNNLVGLVRLFHNTTQSNALHTLMKATAVE